MCSMPTREIGEFVRGLKLFKFFSDEGFSQLINSFASIELPRYSIIFLQGDSATGSYVVHEGLVKSTKLLHSGEECTLELFFPGETFGLRAMFGPNTRPSNAVTLEPSELLFLPQKEIELRTEDLNHLRINAFAILDERLRKLEDRFGDLANRSLIERLASLLVKLSSRKPLSAGQKPVLPLSQWEIANLIGSTRESVSTTLNHFKRKGFLSLRRRQIQIETIEALREIADLYHNG